MFRFNFWTLLVLMLSFYNETVEKHEKWMTRLSINISKEQNSKYFGIFVSSKLDHHYSTNQILKKNRIKLWICLGYIWYRSRWDGGFLDWLERSEDNHMSTFLDKFRCWSEQKNYAKEKKLLLKFESKEKKCLE